MEAERSLRNANLKLQEQRGQVAHWASPPPNTLALASPRHSVSHIASPGSQIRRLERWAGTTQPLPTHSLFEGFPRPIGTKQAKVMDLASFVGQPNGCITEA